VSVTETSEQKLLVDGVLSGVPVDLTGQTVELDPIWLADLLSGRSGQNLHSNGLTMIGATIVGPIDWTGWHFGVSIAFVRCTFTGDLSARRLRVDGDFSMAFSSVSRVDLGGARVSGDLSLPGLSTQTQGRSNHEGETVTYCLGFEWVRVEGSVDLARADIRGGVSLYGAQIGGVLSFSGAKLHNEKSCALCVDNATVTGGVFVGDAFEARGEVRLLGAEIGGKLHCAGAKLYNENGYALSADGATIKNDVVLNESFEARGQVRLLDAEIGGQLNCSGAKLHNENGIALFADGTRVTGNVLLNESFEARGQVRLLDAEIGGQLDCSGAKFYNANGNALFADSARIAKSAFLGEAFEAWGEVRLPLAKIGGQLDCSGAKLHNKNGYALFAPSASITESVALCCDESERPFLAEGKVTFDAAEVGGSLYCDGARFDAPGPEAFSGRDMTVKREFRWKVGARPRGQVSLRGAKVGELNDDIDSWPVDQGTLDLDGFEYGRFGNLAKLDADVRLKWIRVQTAGPKAYRPGPYVQLANVYKVTGQDEESRTVLIAKRRDLRKYGSLHPFHRAWNWLLGAVIGHGYRSWRAAAALVVLYLISVGVVFGAQQNNAFVPVGATATSQVHLQSSQCTSSYPCLSVFAYPVDAVLPVINLHQADYWQFDASRTWGRAGRDWIDFATVLDWTLTTMLIVGLSGLVREG
jgi:hypothetical protein